MNRVRSALLMMLSLGFLLVFQQPAMAAVPQRVAMSQKDSKPATSPNPIECTRTTSRAIAHPEGGVRGSRNKNEKPFTATVTIYYIKWICPKGDLYRPYGVMLEAPIPVYAYFQAVIDGQGGALFGLHSARSGENVQQITREVYGPFSKTYLRVWLNRRYPDFDGVNRWGTRRYLYWLISS